MRRFFLKLVRRRRLQRDLEAELALHRELSEASGNPIPLGNTARITEEAGDLWRFTRIEDIWRDVVYAARGLRRNRALVITAVACLALGIGPNAGIFSLAVELLFSEPSVTDSTTLAAIRAGGNSHAKPEVVEFIRQTGVFADVAGENEETFVNWNDGVETRRIFSVFTTKNYFTMLGVPMLHGRGILPDDPEEVVVLRHQFWKTHFSGDPAVIGRSMNLDGRPCTVVGVLPESHRTLLGFGYSPDIYLPRYLPDTLLSIYARLKSGMSLREAEAALRTIGPRIDAAFPERYWKYANNGRVSAIAGLARLRGEGSEAIVIGLFFVVLLILAGLVLLIACVNVAGLLLARASARRREIAIRLSLGAGRARLVQQLLIESLLLSFAGAVCGFVLAQALAGALARIRLPIPIPIRLQIDTDWRVMLYAAALGVAATLMCGLLPAWQAVRESITSGLPRERRLRLRRTLVAGQVAVSLVVLTTGFLFVRNLLRAAAISPGFDVTRTLRADVNLPPVSYKDKQRIDAYAERVVEALGGLPGIEAVAAARIVPFTDSTRIGADLTLAESGERLHASFHWNAVTAQYFGAMDIPIRHGRSFSAADRGEKVAVVNEAFVRRYLGNGAGAGRTILWGPDGKTPYRIVGVVGGTKNLSIGEDDLPQLYEPLAQIANERTRLQFVLRSATPPAAQLEPVRRALREIEPGAGAEIATLYSSIGLAFLPSQIGAALLGSVGVLGLVLAMVGLYGTMAYAVARRTQEIGLRMAIGASAAHIRRMVVLESARIIAAGSVVGLALAFFVTRPLAIFLVAGLKPTDGVSYIAVTLALAATGMLATWGPMRRALAIEPASSLRYE